MMADLSAEENSLLSHLSKVRLAKASRKAELIGMAMVKRSVTQHALHRYIERILGIDLEKAKDTIRQMADESTLLKDNRHHWNEAAGVALILGPDGRVVTILSKEQSDKYQGRKSKNG